MKNITNSLSNNKENVLYSITERRNSNEIKGLKELLIKKEKELVNLKSQLDQNKIKLNNTENEILNYEWKNISQKEREKILYLEDEIRKLTTKNKEKENIIKELKYSNQKYQKEISELDLKQKTTNSSYKKLNNNNTQEQSNIKEEIIELEKSKVIIPLLKPNKEENQKLKISKFFITYTFQQSKQNDIQQYEIIKLKNQIEQLNTIIQKENTEIISKEKIINDIKDSLNKQIELNKREKDDYINKLAIKNQLYENEIKDFQLIILENTKKISDYNVKITQLEANVKSKENQITLLENSIIDIKEELFKQNEVNVNNNILIEREKTENKTISDKANEHKKIYEAQIEKLTEIINDKDLKWKKELNKYNALYKTYEILLFNTDEPFKIINADTIEDIEKILTILSYENKKLIEYLKNNKINTISIFDNSLLKIDNSNFDILPSEKNTNINIPLLSTSKNCDATNQIKIKQLEANYESAKKLIDTLKQNKEQTLEMWKESNDKVKELQSKLNKFNFIDIDNLKSSYSKLQNCILKLITSISPNLISIDFTMIDSSVIHIDKYIELIKKFEEDINKKQSKVKKYKETLQKVTKIVTDTKKENSTLVNQNKFLDSKIEKMKQFLYISIKNSLNDILTQDVNLIGKSIESIIELIEQEENAKFEDDKTTSDCDRSFISQLSNYSFLNTSSFSTESKSTSKSKLEIKSECIEKNWEDVEKSYKIQIEQLQLEIENLKTKSVTILSPTLKASIEKLLFSIKVKKKNKPYFAKLMNDIGYSVDDIKEFFLKHKEQDADDNKE